MLPYSKVAQNLSSLISKHGLSPDTPFHIRDEKGHLSPPIKLSDLIEGLREAKFRGTELISLYPNEVFQPMASHPLFYDLLLELLEEEDLTQIQKDEITQVLKTHSIQRKKGVTPSKVIPRSSPQRKLFPQREKETPKKSRKPLLIFLMSLFLVLLFLFLWLPGEKKVPPGTLLE